MDTPAPSESPLVSIAMCTYNGEQYLREQVDSLVAQDYPNLEINIVDDRSTDSTFQILEEYAEKHPHIHIHLNEQNLGYRRNFEKALSLCSGELISLCDQDDIWFPHKISTLVREIGDSNLIYSDIQLVDDAGTKLDKTFPPANMLEGNCHMGFLFGNCVTGHACLIRKDLLEKAIPIPGTVKMHDHWIAFVAAATGGIKVHREALSLYRQHDSNAVLVSKGQKRPSKGKRRFAVYEERISFVNAAVELEWLTERDRNLIAEVQAALSKYPRCYTNRALRKLLLAHQDELLQMFLTPEKGLKRLSRGFLRDIF